MRCQVIGKICGNSAVKIIKNVLALNIAGEDPALDVAQALVRNGGVGEAVIALEGTRVFVRVVGEGVVERVLVVRARLIGQVQYPAQASVLDVLSQIRIIRVNSNRLFLYYIGELFLYFLTSKE